MIYHKQYHFSSHFVAQCSKQVLFNAALGKDISVYLIVWFIGQFTKLKTVKYLNFKLISLRAGHTAVYGLFTAKPRQKVESCGADEVFHVNVKFKSIY